MRHERSYVSCPVRRRLQKVNSDAVSERKISISTLKRLWRILSAINNRVRLYSTVKTEDGEILTAKQVKAMQKRLLQLEEENLILKKAIAIFTPDSKKD